MRMDGRWMLAALAAWVGSGCNGGGQSDLILEDANNYTQTSDISFGQADVMEGTDTTIDWGALTVDLRGRPLDDANNPLPVNQIVFSEIEMTEDELKQRVLSNDIPQSEAVSATYGVAAGETSVNLSQFDLLGNPFDPADLVSDGQNIWIATLIHVPEGTSEQQVLYSMVVAPGPLGGEAPPIEMVNGETTVSVVPDLTGPTHLSTVADAGPYTLEWSSLTQDVFGKPFDNLVANTLVILNYPGTVEDVQNDFLLVDYNATNVYRLDVYGLESAKLEDATSTEDGSAFPGFTEDGTWLVGLVDNQSLSPLPLVMAVVDVGK